MTEKVWLTNHLWALEASTDNGAYRGYIRQIIAVLDGAPALMDFAIWAIQQGWRYSDVDAADIHEKAVKLGLVVKTQYDPEKHGPSEFDCPPGDDWYVFAPLLSSAVAQTKPGQSK